MNRQQENHDVLIRLKRCQIFLKKFRKILKLRQIFLKSTIRYIFNVYNYHKSIAGVKLNILYWLFWWLEFICHFMKVPEIYFQKTEFWMIFHFLPEPVQWCLRCLSTEKKLKNFIQCILNIKVIFLYTCIICQHIFMLWSMFSKYYSWITLKFLCIIINLLSRREELWHQSHLFWSSSNTWLIQQSL